MVPKGRTEGEAIVFLKFRAVDRIGKCLQVFDENHSDILRCHLMELKKVEFNAWMSQGPKAPKNAAKSNVVST